MANVKYKGFRIDEDLALDFEIRAKKLKISETELITRYIKYGLQRDENQSNLDEIVG
jgi:hypothetical protein